VKLNSILTRKKSKYHIEGHQGNAPNDAGGGSNAFQKAAKAVKNLNATKALGNL
jgi:hypothetical protein